MNILKLSLSLVVVMLLSTASLFSRLPKEQPLGSSSSSSVDSQRVYRAEGPKFISYSLGNRTCTYLKETGEITCDKTTSDELGGPISISRNSPNFSSDYFYFLDERYRQQVAEKNEQWLAEKNAAAAAAADQSSAQ